jgi:hypothetical protein
MPRRKYEDNIEINVKEILSGNGDKIYLDWGRVQRVILLRTVTLSGFRERL